MKNKKLIPLLILPLLTVTACSDEVKALPTDYNDQLVRFDGDHDVHNNISSIIYDAKRDNDTVAKTVLNEILLELSKSIFGDFATELEPRAKEAIALNGNTTTVTGELKTFIDKHSVYAEDTKDDYTKACIRLINTYNRVKDTIAKKFFKAIDGNFTRDGKFYEEDYLMSLRKTLKDVANPADSATAMTKGFLITPEFDAEDVFTSNLLHEANYTNYIKKDIVPEVYRELLVEQYILDTNYATLGRSYARNVDIITVQNKKDTTFISDLMNAYVDNFINTDVNFGEHQPSFDIISTAIRGYGLIGDEVAASQTGTVKEQAKWLLNELVTKESIKVKEITPDAFTQIAGPIKYYEGTSFGDMVEKLGKITADLDTNKADIESEFTNNGEYTIAQGYAAKQVSIQKESFVTDGWHIRSGGLSSINETVRNRIFNIGVSNALDNEYAASENDKVYPDRFTGTDYTNAPKGENKYVARINGRYFLKPTDTERPSTTDVRTRDMLYYDSGADAFTIVEIHNAVSTSKLLKDSQDNYENRVEDKKAGFDNMEQIAHEVASQIATGESYRALSTKYWLKEASIEYHDQDIYDYFHDNYSELFEEE